MHLTVVASPDQPTSAVEKSWSEIHALTAAMQEAAALEEWQEVVEMAVTRHRSLLDHFSRFPVGPDNATFYHGRLTEMLQGEQELQAIAVAARREVMRRSVASTQSRRAVGAYLVDQ